MRLRVRLKSLAVVGVVATCALVYSLDVGMWQTEKPTRIARITGEDLHMITWQAPDTVASPTRALNTTQAIKPSANAPCDRPCQFRRLREQRQELSRQMMKQGVTQRPVPGVARVQAAIRGVSSSVRTAQENLKSCDQACRVAKMREHRKLRGGYSSRVQVENVTLPTSWTVTKELVDRLSARRTHVKEVCQQYRRDKSPQQSQPNAWEFLVNEDYGLVWCNVFKAASSTWFYNFNLLAGFTETELLHSKETPIMLARKKYPRPSVEELSAAMNTRPRPLAFMIARHPLKRLVSGYRDKILSGSRFYSKLSRSIMKQYQALGPPEVRERNANTFIKPMPRAIVPSFPQFVQFLLDEWKKGQKLDEHWTPMSEFCTPCLFDFDVYAKVETLEEDGNYIIFSAGIENVIKPKRINRARNEPTDAVADKFLCQLSATQMQGLLDMYKYDLELFEYDASKYVNCTKED